MFHSHWCGFPVEGGYQGDDPNNCQWTRVWACACVWVCVCECVCVCVCVCLEGGVVGKAYQFGWNRVRWSVPFLLKRNAHLFLWRTFNCTITLYFPGHQRSTNPVLANPQVSVPLISWLVGSSRKGGTTPIHAESGCDCQTIDSMAKHHKTCS